MNVDLKQVKLSFVPIGFAISYTTYQQKNTEPLILTKVLLEILSITGKSISEEEICFTGQTIIHVKNHAELKLKKLLEVFNQSKNIYKTYKKTEKLITCFGVKVCINTENATHEEVDYWNQIFKSIEDEKTVMFLNFSSH